jgi:GNAT superfamily N-acetyltransferase
MIDSIRDISPADLPELSALAIRSKASWGYDGTAMATFTEELTLTDETLAGSAVARVACTADGTMLGYYTLRRMDAGGVELDFMFVDPAYFRQGVGRGLLEDAKRKARALEASHLHLIADPNAEGFYAKHGADIVGMHRSSIPGREIPIMEIPL